MELIGGNRAADGSIRRNEQLEWGSLDTLLHRLHSTIAERPLLTVHSVLGLRAVTVHDGCTAGLYGRRNRTVQAPKRTANGRTIYGPAP